MWHSPLLYLTAAVLQGDSDISADAAARKAHKAMKEIERLDDEDQREATDLQRKRDELHEQAKKMVLEDEDVLGARSELAAAQKAFNDEKQRKAGAPAPYTLEDSLNQLIRRKTEETFAKLTKKAGIPLHSRRCWF